MSSPTLCAIARESLRPGMPVGPNDLQIAAHARALGLTVVAANLK
ncbi:Virulence-associated protein VapC-like protein [Azoarcus sp. CIB]|nr:Virulence-associated protein VapC-like protein [Azoarcus sp. CIB]